MSRHCLNGDAVRVGRDLEHLLEVVVIIIIIQDMVDTEASAAERASGHRAEVGEPASVPETPRAASADHEKVLCVWRGGAERGSAV